jgi:hypothetical protein
LGFTDFFLNRVKRRRRKASDSIPQRSEDSEFEDKPRYSSEAAGVACE